jgi:hypothetical protein
MASLTPTPRKLTLNGSLRAVLFGAIVLAAPWALMAQLSNPRLLSIFPPGGKSGTEVEPTISGQDLERASELRFSHSGLTTTVIGSNKFKVEIERNVPAGIYDVRVISSNGISNPRAFAVGTLNELTLEKAPTARELAKEVPLNSVVNARAETNAIQYFEVSAQKGQRVLVSCEARAIDSRLEPVLSALDESGREIDHDRTGGLLDFTPTADGRFIIKVHDVIFRGGPEYWYRLSVGTFAQVDFVVPSAVTPGRNKISLFGRNLPGGKLREDVKVEGKSLEALEVEIDVPSDSATRRASLAGVPIATAQAGLDLFAYRFASKAGVANPVLFSVARSPVTPAQEWQNSSLPCDIAGQFRARGPRELFTFKAKKGEAWWIEVVSQRLGLPTDPLVVVQRVSGESTNDVLELNDSEANLGGAEFNTMHRDPSGRFDVKEDGTYRVMLRDLFAPSRPDPRRVFHLSIRKPAPDFSLVAIPQSPPSTKKDAKDITLAALAAGRGETVALKVLALRRDGFGGDIELSAGDLPEGVTVAPTRIDGGKNSTLVFLTVGEDAALTNAAIVIQGSATNDGARLVRSAALATLVWGTPDPATDAAVARLSADAALSVLEASLPVRVRASSNVIETVAGRSVKVNFLIERRAPYKGGVKLKTFGLAALDSVPELDVDAAATNLVFQIDLKEKKIPAGTHVFALQVTPQGKVADSSKKPKDSTLTFYSAPVVLRVRPAPVAATNSPAK